METTISIKVIIGSTCPNRFSEKPAHWIFEEAQKREGVRVELPGFTGFSHAIL